MVSSSAADLSLVAGVLALDFANTASGRGTSAHREHLHTVADVIAWGAHAGCLGRTAMERLPAGAVGSADAPSDTEALRGAIQLREAIFGLGTAIAGGRDPAPENLDVVRQATRDALAAGRLQRGEDGGYVLDFADAAPVAAVAGAVALSALDMLRTADFARIKQCPGRAPDNDCQWLFLDTSKNNARRWCDMATCGNRMKSRRHRARRQGEP